jgi:anti-anti-sigma factor
VDVLVESDSATLVVRLRGEIDIATHDELSARLNTLDLTAYDVVRLHLDELDFCDSTGVHELLSFVDRIRTAGAVVELEGARPQPARMLALVGASSAA